MSVMKRKFENQKHKAQVSNVENNSQMFAQKGFWLGLGWRNEEEGVSPKETKR